MFWVFICLFINLGKEIDQKKEEFGKTMDPEG